MWYNFYGHSWVLVSSLKYSFSLMGNITVFALNERHSDLEILNFFLVTYQI